MLPEYRILELQEDLIAIYDDIESALVLSVSSRFSYNDEPQSMELWQTQKLNEMGALTKENRKIIAKRSGKAEEEVKKMFTSMSYESVVDDEKVYKKAIKKGLIQPVGPISSSKAIDRIVSKAIAQGNLQLNLVNTKALESSNKAFLRIVNQVFIEVDGGIYDYKTAIRRGVTQLADKGITGQSYVTKDGQIINYPMNEAVRREVVTASLDTAREAQDARGVEYGSDLIEVTSHAGARPKCAIDQGKIYSNSGKSKKYPARSTTSEGDADGLFGVNCKHQHYPYFEGLSIKRSEPVPLKENRKAAEESQQQRYLEREVRKEKRRVMAREETGDAEGAAASQKKLTQKNKNLSGFMKETGRTQQKRTSVPGYDR